MLVPAPTTSPARDRHALAFLRQVADYLARVGAPRDRTGRHRQDEIGSIASVLLLRRAVAAAVGAIQPLIPELAESVDRQIGDEDDVRAASAVATVRTAAGDKLLSVEADKPVPTISALYLDLCVINQGGILIGYLVSIISVWNMWKFRDLKLEQMLRTPIKLRYVKRIAVFA